MGVSTEAETITKVIVGDKVIELTDEQLRLFGNIKTRLQRNVALKSLEGLSDAEAYRQGGGKATNPNSLTSSASEILNNPDVVAFIESFNAYLVASSIMTREEMLERLTGMARTDITDVIDFHNSVVVGEVDGQPVTQSCWSIKDAGDIGAYGVSAISELTAGKEGIKIKLHDQKAAMKQIADLEGYNAAVRLAIGGDPKGTPIQYSDLSDDDLQAELAKYGLKPENT